MLVDFGIAAAPTTVVSVIGPFAAVMTVSTVEEERYADEDAEVEVEAEAEANDDEEVAATAAAVVDDGIALEVGGADELSGMLEGATDVLAGTVLGSADVVDGAAEGAAEVNITLVGNEEEVLRRPEEVDWKSSPATEELKELLSLLTCRAHNLASTAKTIERI